MIVWESNWDKVHQNIPTKNPSSDTIVLCPGTVVRHYYRAQHS